MMHAEPVGDEGLEGLACVSVSVLSRAVEPELQHPFMMYVERADGVMLAIAAMSLSDVALFVIETSPCAVSCRGTHDEVEALRALTTEPCGTLQ